jgi:hypothetical protein
MPASGVICFGDGIISADDWDDGNRIADSVPVRVTTKSSRALPENAVNGVVRTG